MADFAVLTLFPRLFDSFLAESLLAKAIAKGLTAVEIIDVRDYCFDRHRTADDRPYGGGPGMVIMAEPLALALEALLARGGPKPLVVHLTPSGRTLNQELVRSLAKQEKIALVCGRYEGIDQRFVDSFVDLEISVGDYVLNGGEVPAMAIIEATARLLPGFMGHPGSTLDESHGYGLLEHPLYTRPQVWRGQAVPDILLSGNHAQISAFRLSEAVAKTRLVRPELLDNPNLVDQVAQALDGKRPEKPPKAAKTPPGPKKAPTPDRPGRLAATTAQSDGDVMSHKEINGKAYPVDEEGFLLDHGLWDEDWVKRVSDEEEIEEMTEDHYAVLESLREYHVEHGVPPRVKDMTKVTGFKMKYIYEMFPSGPGKGACKMAGLPKPEGCV
jgi:tRNA (guanine37-N1)-methyltransferase